MSSFSNGEGSQTSIATDLTARLSSAVDSLAASTSSASPQLRASQEEDDSEDDEETQDVSGHSTPVSTPEETNLTALSSMLAKVRKNNGHASASHRSKASSGDDDDMQSALVARPPTVSTRLPSLEKLISQVEEAQALDSDSTVAVSFLDKAIGKDKKARRTEQELGSLLAAHLTITAWGLSLSSLLDQAEKVREEESYWQVVEARDWEGGLYLLQTLPLRIANALRVLLARLQGIAASPRPPKSLLSLRVVRRALPPSLLITSLFPHLAKSPLSTATSDNSAPEPPTLKRERKLLYLTFSPLLLTRQEVSLKRERLREMRYGLARKIGRFVQDAEEGLADIRKAQKLGDLQNVVSGRMQFLQSSVTEGQAVDSTEQPSDSLKSLQAYLSQGLQAQSNSTASMLSVYARPSFLVRSWPKLLLYPLGTLFLYRRISSSRTTLLSYYEYIRETISGYITNWVVTPLYQIAETLRQGENSNAMALMSKESLKSDRESLVRMVADFAKTVVGVQGQELSEVVGRVELGDMSVVLEAYEKELKSPLKSAVMGNLVRTLLIQVQKVKVDVDLAMDGIEKMLRSQQLTFAFVGVAPSMVLLYALGKFGGNLLLTTSPNRSTVAYRRRVSQALRNIDRILTSSLDSQLSDSDEQKKHKGKGKKGNERLDDLSLGLLLVELMTLREFGNSKRGFPSGDRSVRESFLEDVQDLEEPSKGLKSRLRTFHRLNRGYEGLWK